MTPRRNRKNFEFKKRAQLNRLSKKNKNSRLKPSTAHLSINQRNSRFGSVSQRAKAVKMGTTRPDLDNLPRDVQAQIMSPGGGVSYQPTILDYN